MQQYRFTSDLPVQDFDRPQCPQCGSQMWLARIEPGRPGHDKRTFECPACEHVETRDIKYR